MRLPALLRDIADFCFPAACAICRAKADAWPLCGDCLGTLENLERSAGCPRCGLPIPQIGAPCPHCLNIGLRPYASVQRLGVFSEPLREMIHRLKFHRAWGLGEFFADRLLARPAVRELLARADVIVPVPLHPLRQLQRGYNQSEVIARRLGKLAGRPMRRAARRVKHTEAQTRMQSRTARLENLKDAFALADGRAIAGKIVVVVDDVRTTGATLRCVGRCLRAARPMELHAVVVAVADPLRADFLRI